MHLAKRALVLFLGCSLSPVPLLAQQAGAVLYVNGRVTVNGNPAVNSAAIFPGDTVQTGADSSADITSQGASAQMAAHSSVTLQSQQFQYQEGALTVAGQAPWQVRVGAMTVSLGTEVSKIEVLQRQDVVLIKLLQGSASVSEGAQTTALKVNFTLARPYSGGKGAAPAAVAHSSHRAIVLVVVAAGAAAAAGLALRGGKSSSTPTPLSPSVP